jgi:hypothetical protein
VSYNGGASYGLGFMGFVLVIYVLLVIILRANGFNGY